MEVSLCKCQCLTELVGCRNVVVAKVQDFVVIVVVWGIVVVVVEVGVIIVKEVDVVRVVTVAENVGVVVDQVFSRQ
ncbi:hypothetical protein CON06_25750 [Bacillus cereus]|nr:hypothetical protein CON06_25750 [Bacillus cereus]PFM34599.1 hypothetical protein COJ43_24400 [Bacillus cereus]PGL56800.1 hypothetical protein CN927_26840 [Bacillus cereus]